MKFGSEGELRERDIHVRPAAYRGTFALCRGRPAYRKLEACAAVRLNGIEGCGNIPPRVAESEATMGESDLRPLRIDPDEAVGQQQTHGAEQAKTGKTKWGKTLSDSRTRKYLESILITAVKQGLTPTLFRINADGTMELSLGPATPQIIAPREEVRKDEAPAFEEVMR